MTTLDTIQDAPDILMEFLEYHSTVRGHSDKTVMAYYTDLKILFRFLKKRRHLVDASVPFDAIDITDVDLDFIESIRIEELYRYQSFSPDKQGSLSAASRCRRTSSVKSFFFYLTAKRHLLDHNICQELDMPKRKASLPRYLEESECEKLLDACKGTYMYRDYAILMLFMSCGLRISELVSLNLTDVYEDHVRVLGKGNKERVVYFGEGCREALDDYLMVRDNGKIHPDARNALFISRNGNRISPKTVQWLVKKYLSEIGLTSLNGSTGYSVHKLRHTAATLMYQHGNVDIRILKDILGHESLSTTEIYTHLSNTQMEKAAESNPLSKIKKRKD